MVYLILFFKHFIEFFLKKSLVVKVYLLDFSSTTEHRININVFKEIARECSSDPDGDAFLLTTYRKHGYHHS